MFLHLRMPIRTMSSGSATTCTFRGTRVPNLDAGPFLISSDQSGDDDCDDFHRVRIDDHDLVLEEEVFESAVLRNAVGRFREALGQFLGKQHRRTFQLNLA